MNLAFYMMASSSLFVVWFVIVIIFIADRLSFWRFRGAQIERVQRFASILGRAPESYSVMHVRLTRYSDDLLAHKILGLGIIGLAPATSRARSPSSAAATSSSGSSTCGATRAACARFRR
jgi:hypothetical protein